MITNALDCLKDIQEGGGDIGGEDTEGNGEENIDFAHFCFSSFLYGISVLGSWLSPSCVVCVTEEEDTDIWINM